MLEFSQSILNKIKLTLRETSDDFDEEIRSYIEACVQDLKDSGISSSYFETSVDCNPRILQAIRWYCLAHYGLYNPDMEKYDKAYHSLKATLCTQKYSEV